MSGRVGKEVGREWEGKGGREEKMGRNDMELHIVAHLFFSSMD